MAAEAPPKPKTLPGLTGLRGIGALWVVAYHLQFGLGIPILGAGYLGVDLFLILSGFVLSYAHPEPRWTWSRYRSFLYARFARIFPMHWFALALLAGLLLAVPAIRSAAPLRYGWPELLASAALVQNWGLTSPVTWNIPAWTLSAEWALSIAFPVFPLLANRIRSARSALFLGAACILAFAVFLAITHNDGPNVVGRAGLVRAVCEFAAGCILYRAFAAGTTLPAPMTWTAILLTATGAAIPSLAVIAVFGMLLIVMLSAQSNGAIARALSSKPLVFLGDISYSIYLLHYPLLLAFQELRRKGTLDVPTTLLWDGLYLAVILSLSTMTYRLIERPARNTLRSLGRKSAGRSRSRQQRRMAFSPPPQPTPAPYPPPIPENTRRSIPSCINIRNPGIDSNDNPSGTPVSSSATTSP